MLLTIYGLRSGRGAAVYGTLGGLPGIFTEATNFGPSPAAAALPAGHGIELKILWKHRTNTESNKASIHCGSEEFETKNIFPKKNKSKSHPNTCNFFVPASGLYFAAGPGTRTASTNK